LDPRSYVTEDLWKQAPVLTGSTKFEPLSDAKNILITGGAGFMYVDCMGEAGEFTRQGTRRMLTRAQSMLVCPPSRPDVPRPLQCRLVR
jgi:hypothetical protein